MELVEAILAYLDHRVSRYICGAPDCGRPVASGSRKRCDDCIEAARKERKRRERRARRVAHRAIPSEPYTLAYIAERDRYMCSLCRKRVAMTKAVPHPKAPTIDHTVPLACGGHDVKANVRLAHFECNWRKAAGGAPEQLLLIG